MVCRLLIVPAVSLSSVATTCLEDHRAKERQSVSDCSYRNVYPPKNATRYPERGDVFTVRYLRSHLDDFVIVNNDGSPWNTRLRCEGLAVAAALADQKASFAPENPPFQQAVQAAHAALQSAGCGEEESGN